MTILCVAEPYEPDLPPKESTPPEASLPLPNESEVPGHSTRLYYDELELIKQVLEKLETVENLVNQQFALMQVMQDVQAGKLIKLQTKLETLE